MPNTIPISILEKYTTFGDLLRFLRRRAGLTQLEFSIAVGYSDSQISRLEQNMRLPDPPIIVARFLPALFLEDEPQAVARLMELAAHVRRQDAPALGLRPYKGLEYFDEADAELFVGREVLTDKLAQQVLTMVSHPEAGRSSFFAIVGASGSGKSSLVRAGLVPALRWNKSSASWPIHILTPSAHPLESLATALAQENGSLSLITTLMDDMERDPRALGLFIKRELKKSGGAHLLLLVDQFEELFTICRSEVERSAFIDNLLRATTSSGGQAVVIITLRADFYTHCSSYLELREALAVNQEYIGAMSDEEMHRAIEEPARRGRWEFEPSLVDLILHDVGREPGALPLLSHALLETWQRRHGRRMTLSGYASAGGVRGAIAETAEAVFTDRFNPKQQAIARRIFIRLTELGDETSTGDTRRRATFSELILKPEEAQATLAVLKALADARLVTTSEDSVQVAHEALIREWPTLRNWLEDNREGLRLHRHLTEAADDWLTGGCEPGLLYRGARLARAREWAVSHSADMNEPEREFLAVSLALAESEATERETQHQRELAAAQKLADTERRRAEEGQRFTHLLRRRAMLISGVGLLAVLLAVFSLFAWQRSATNAAINQSMNLARAAEQANASGRGDLALVLAKEAFNQNPQSVEALKTLREVAFSSGTRAILSGHSHAVRTIAMAPNAKTAVSGSCVGLDSTGECQAGELILWDLATYQVVQRWSAHSSWVTSVAFAPGGQTVISGGSDGSLIQWSLDGEEIQRFSGHNAGITALAILASINGLLSSSSDGTLILWNLYDGKILQQYDSAPVPIITIAAATSTLMAVSAQQDGSIKLWNLLKAQALNTFKYMGSGITSVAISPDGSWFLYTNNAIPNLYIRKVDSLSGTVLSQYNFDCSPGQIALNPGVSYVFITCQSALYQLAVKDLEEQQAYLDSPDFINFITVSQDGQFVLSGTANGTLRLWNIGIQLAYEVIDIRANQLRGFDITSDGNDLVLNYASINGKEAPVLWNLGSRQVSRTFLGFDGIISPGAVAISPDDNYFAVAGLLVDPSDSSITSPTVMVWHLFFPNFRCRFDQFDGLGRAVAFSPDSQYLLAGTQNQTNKSGQLLLLKVNTCEVVRQFHSTEAVTSIAFNFDGSRAITGMGYLGRVILWDVASGNRISSYDYSNYGSTLPVAFSPDGSQILAAGPADLFLMDVATSNITRSYSGLAESPNSISISPDGKYIVSAARDGNIILWDFTTGEKLHRINLHQRVVEAKFGPDSKVVYAITEAQKLIKWPIAEKSIAELLQWIDQNRYVRDLTCLEKLQYQLVSRCNP